MKSILKNINIVDVVKRYIPLQLRGQNYFGLCPFHADDNPSLSVNEKKQIYKCFSCGNGGDAIKFVAEKEKISYLTACRKIAE